MSDIITMGPNGLVTGNHPTIPFIEGDGIGPDIWKATRSVIDAAVAKAYSGERSIDWLELLAGEKAFQATGSWLPQETLDGFTKYRVGIKGPLTTPIGGGIEEIRAQAAGIQPPLAPVLAADHRTLGDVDGVGADSGGLFPHLVDQNLLGGHPGIPLQGGGSDFAPHGFAGGLSGAENDDPAVAVTADVFAGVAE